jgi:NAD(P)-dependent dehydrogenase (short-subunit alcohol dehydrogenase family)
MTKVALITGAGTGIGRAVALALANAGYSVALIGRRLALLEETASIATQAGAQTLVHAADVGQADEVAAAFAATIKRFGRIDVVFNNAGIGAPAIALEDLTVEQWKAVVDVNLSGVFYCMQEAFRAMKAQVPMGGRIINNGSISAHAPRPDSAPYTATKHAVTGLTKAAALDGRRYDIAVGQIDIGNAGTDMAAKMALGIQQADGTIRAEPLMDVARVGEAVVHMASMPLDANVLFMTVMATKMPYVGRG